MDKILRINMSGAKGPEIKTEALNGYAGLGGRAMTSSVVANEVPPSCHPLSAENKLVIAPGLLSGSAAAMSGRLSVGCKSPLTGGIKESNAGGQPSQMLARLGYAAVILEGKPTDDTLYKVLINTQGATIQPDNSLKMLGNYDIVDKMKAAHEGKISCISIGQAGEMKLSAASIACTDMEQRPTRHCGRGGVGAVMGAKGIKVIVIDDAGTKQRSPSDADKFKAANKAFVAGLRKHPVTGEGLPAYGTNVLTNVLNEAGGYPTNNFSSGQFDGAAKISGETQAELENERGGKGSATHGCHRGCIIRCSGTFYDKNGNYLTKQPEYETVWSHGGNCGIDDIDAIAQLDRLDDDFGLDTIEMGATVAVAMEAGIVQFGDAQGAIGLVQQVGEGTPMGRILGNGAAVTGRVFGVERVPVVKGQAMPAYDPRTVQGIGVTYATSTMGADHTAGYAVATNILGVGGNVDPLKPVGQVELSRNLQIATAAIDATGMCLFIAFAILDQPDTFQALLDVLGGFTGQPLTADDVTALGQSILQKERDFNLKAGFTKEDDRLPDYFKNEKLPPHNITFGVSDKDLDEVFNF
jgi:aldehyde:ferredoxin oxidoreductase